MPKFVIVNADDFGKSASVNLAIIRAFKSRLISSTTLMANMPGFSDACTLTTQNDLHGKVGIHLNLVEGHPLTDAMSACHRFCDSKGRFFGKPTLRSKDRLTNKEVSILSTEVEAQIQRCRDNGIEPTHLDSHHHYHTCWPIGAVVLRTARRLKIGAIRIGGNLRRLSVAGRLLLTATNMRIRWYGFRRVDYFGDVITIGEHWHRLKGVIEIMVHVDVQADNGLWDPVECQPLKTELRPFCDAARVSYKYLYPQSSAFSE